MLSFEHRHLLHNFSYLNTGCKNGMYGRSCRYYCSGNCLHNVPCNSTNGHCDSGCASGYLDVFCNKSKYFRELQELLYIR